MDQMRKGGGTKKVLYTLNTIRKIGIAKSAKALTAKNTCKACALGMGGQLGGMTNEAGEFPSVCNKSVQAQSTDIQPEIPEDVFAHTLEEFRELSPRETEQLGRLGFPLHKPLGEDRFRKVSWEFALERASRKLRETNPNRSFFYSSGRSSNEAAFIFQLFARLYGTNNVSNCSYYCHQATGVGLNSTIGTGTATVELADLAKADLVFVIGANPASNHPRLLHQLQHVRERGGHVVVINPAREPGLVKFAVPKSPKSLLTGGTSIASEYVQPRIGEDLTLIKGIAKSILETSAEDRNYVDLYTTDFEGYSTDIHETSWDTIVERTGVSRHSIETVAEIYAKSKSTVFAWGMGITHHLNGVDNVEAIASLALLRGMIGKPGSGLLPLRGHSNVQGIGTIGVKPVLMEDVTRKIEQELGVNLPAEKGLDTMACMQAAFRDEMDAAIIMGGNLYASNPNSQWAKKALEKVGFKLFLTTTLNQGHVTGVDDGECILLPVTSRDEEWEPTTQESMFNYVRMSDGGIHRLPHVRPESVILADLATAVLPETPVDFQAFKRHATVRQAIARIVPGMEELADIDVARKEFHIKNRLLHSPKFETPSGKGSFKTASLPSLDKRKKFALTTVRSEGQFNSIVYEEADSYRGTKTRWCILMNEVDIQRLNLAADKTVTVKSDFGEMTNLVVYAFDIPKGNVMAYYPEANVLTGTATDPLSRTPSFKLTHVDVFAD